MSFALITKCSIHKLYKNRSSFTSWSPIYYITNIHIAAVKKSSKMMLIHNFCLNIRDIINLRLGGEREHSPHFVYRSLCNQSQTLIGIKWASHLGSEFKWYVLATISDSATELRPIRIKKDTCHVLIWIIHGKIFNPVQCHIVITNIVQD